MLSMQYLVLCLTAGLLQPALAVPLTVDVSITVDGDTVTSSSSAVSDDDSAGSSDDTTSSYWPSDSTYCNGTAYNEDLLDTYVCGDWRLGPVQLPSEAPPISTSEINTYNQLGSYEPADFLQDFWNDTEYDWIYPPENGFIIDAVTGEPITGTFELQSDAYIDSFATNIRGLLYPASTPYQQRSLPPSNLDASESDPQLPDSYYMYSVLEPFTVLAGPIAPWFGQEGQGVQYQLLPNQTFENLMDQGYLGLVLRGDGGDL